MFNERIWKFQECFEIEKPICNEEVYTDTEWVLTVGMHSAHTAQEQLSQHIITFKYASGRGPQGMGDEVEGAHLSSVTGPRCCLWRLSKKEHRGGKGRISPRKHRP